MKRKKTYQVGLEDTRSSFLVHNQGSGPLGLFHRLDLPKVLLHTLQLSVYGVVLGVRALETKIGWREWKHIVVSEAFLWHVKGGAGKDTSTGAGEAVSQKRSDSIE